MGIGWDAAEGAGGAGQEGLQQGDQGDEEHPHRAHRPGGEVRGYQGRYFKKYISIVYRISLYRYCST